MQPHSWTRALLIPSLSIAWVNCSQVMTLGYLYYMPAEKEEKIAANLGRSEQGNIVFFIPFFRNGPTTTRSPDSGDPKNSGKREKRGLLAVILCLYLAGSRPVLCGGLRGNFRTVLSLLSGS